MISPRQSALTGAVVRICDHHHDAELYASGRQSGHKKPAGSVSLESLAVDSEHQPKYEAMACLEAINAWASFLHASGQDLVVDDGDTSKFSVSAAAGNTFIAGSCRSTGDGAGRQRDRARAR